MADYDRNAAYDLSRFAPAEVKTAPGTKEVRRPDKPEIVQEKIKTARERRNEKRRRQLLLRRTVFVGATLLMLAGLRLSGEVQVAQLDKEIKQQTALLEDAQAKASGWIWISKEVFRLMRCSFLFNKPVCKRAIVSR